MTRNNKTRHALLMSMMSILLCVAMLIGSTFAWFTDTASTAVNKIQAGTLNIALQMKDGESWKDAEGETLNFVKADEADDGEAILWEPGATYELPELRVVNNGNLAVKYTLQVTGIQGDEKLNEVIEWTVKNADANYDLAAEHKLAAKTDDTEVYDAFTIKGHMKENAGNEYQGLSIDGIGITVLATQDTVEYDSYNNTYDAKAPVYEATPETIQDVLDSVKDYAVIKLKAGEYGTIYFRQSEQSEPFASNATGTGNEALHINGANVTYDYHGGRTDVTYMRTLNNITIEGCEGANVDNIVFMDGNYEYAADNESTVSGNTIYTLENTRTEHGTDTDWTNKLISFFTVKNLTFKNINFTGTSTVLSLSYKTNDPGLDTWTYRLNIDGLTFDGCTMTVKDKAKAETDEQKMLLDVGVGNTTEAIYKNFVVRNCTIDADRVMRVDGVENITVANNTFKNISYRDILLSQGGNSCGVVSGTVIISDNTSDSGKERFVRIGDATNMNLTITDNTVTNYKGADSDYIKVTGTPLSKVVSGNTVTDGLTTTRKTPLYINVA